MFDTLWQAWLICLVTVKDKEDTYHFTHSDSSKLCKITKEQMRNHLKQFISIAWAYVEMKWWHTQLEKRNAFKSVIFDISEEKWWKLLEAFLCMKIPLLVSKWKWIATAESNVPEFHHWQGMQLQIWTEQTTPIDTHLVIKPPQSLNIMHIYPGRLKILQKSFIHPSVQMKLPNYHGSRSGVD